MHENELETKLSRLNLAKASDTYLEKGLGVIHAGQPVGGFWQRYLPTVLATALVISVSGNIFQLVSNRQQMEAMDAEQLAQCNTPAAASAADVGEEFHFAVSDQELQPLGMC